MADILETNCQTGEVIERSFTTNERTRHDRAVQAQIALERAQEARADQRTADIARLRAKAKTDPDFAALLRTMNIDTEGS